MLNLDTHILLHTLTGTLTTSERRALSAESWSISGIVLWEIAKLSELGRITVNLDDENFASAMTRIHIWPITVDICRQIKHLDFKSDPADEIIAATSIVHGARLVTRDRKMLRSKLVPLAI